MPKTVEGEFNVLCQAAMSQHASEVQIQECRRFFFAGAFMAFGLILDAAADDKTEDQGAEELSALYDECKGTYPFDASGT